jgi:glycosyltransferase involved in cell wall biosynthesis
MLWIATGLAPEITGIERLVIESVSGFAKLCSAEQWVLTDAGAEWSRELDDHATVVTAARRRGEVGRAPNLRVRQWSDEALAVHSFSAPFPARLGTAARLSYTVHDWGPYFDSGIAAAARIAWGTAILRGTYRAQLIHSLAPSTLAEAPRWMRRHLRGKEIVTGLPYRVSEAGLSSSMADPRGREADLVISVGSHVPRKRFDLLYRACRVLPEVRLILAGAGTEHVGHGDSGDAGGWIERRGHVDDAELERLYRRAALFVLPSLYEGFGLSVLEAWQLGCPILITEGVAKRLPPEITQDVSVVPADISAGELGQAIRTILATGPVQRQTSLMQERPLVEVLAARVDTLT